jgi:hypothetical protein
MINQAKYQPTLAYHQPRKLPTNTYLSSTNTCSLPTMKATNHHLLIINQAKYQPTLAYHQPRKLPTITCLSSTNT